MNGNIFAKSMVFCVTLLFLITGTVAAARGERGGKNFLWQVQSKKGVVYLFGSVHLAKPEIYPLAPRIEESFAKARILAVEADPEKGSDPALQQRILRAALYPEGETLEQHLSKDTFELAGEEMRRAGIPAEQFNRMKPWFLALTIGTFELQRLGYQPEYGLDRYFAGKARGKKKIVELESFEHQINVLNGFTGREQDLFLRYTILDIKSVDQNIDALMRSWQTGDVKEVERLVMQTLHASPELLPVFEKLFFRRNREMTDKIEQFLQTRETCFVVVGAAHLVGKQGIVELLKAKGYKINQM